MERVEKGTCVTCKLILIEHIICKDIPIYLESYQIFNIGLDLEGPVRLNLLPPLTI